MRLLFALASLLWATTAMPVYAADNNVVVGRATNDAVLDTSSADTCEPTLVEHFTRYLVHHIPPNQLGRNLLVKQEFEVGSGCFESYHPAKVTLTANPIEVKTGVVDSHAVWSFSTEGTSGQLELWDMAGLYRIDMPACCAGEETSKYYTLDNGQLIGSSTATPYSILFQEMRGRDLLRQESHYLTIESNLASSPQGIKGAMATLFWADRTGVIETLSVSSKNSAREGWSVRAFGFEKHGSDLVVPYNETLKLHISMVCQCDSSPFDISLPVTVEGLNEKEAIVTGAKDVVLTKSLKARP